MAAREAALRRVDERLQAWRQGDCVVGEHWFLFRVDPQSPIVEDAILASPEAGENIESQVSGFAIITQTCDLARRCDDRPFVEVSPLVEVEESTLREIERGRRPNYAYLRGLANQGLVVDIDRVMTAAWLDRVPPQGRFVDVSGLVQSLDDLTARDYVDSDPLDLDHLSSR